MAGPDCPMTSLARGSACRIGFGHRGTAHIAGVPDAFVAR
jgi:hypothetical protein